ncbi:UNVERIFIED_CONTAM: hypothetical protein HDU68_009622 [Siphonaria sp. JEL0065]|nr:hypothetical protein HDU68_009622 [Siphonaria sp. JEL0065]
MTETPNPFSHLVDLALNGSILFATDDFFQVAESILLEHEPVWDATKFTPFGKWMDGWETRRKRIEGHDWCLLKLGLSGTIQGIHVDTAFFTGNQTPRLSIQAACFGHDPPLLPRKSELGTCATPDELLTANNLGSDKWDVILPMIPLQPGYPSSRHHYFQILQPSKRYTHLRINYFPDGGVARLRVHGTVQKDWSQVSSDELIDLVALENGATPISCTNKHYGTPFNLLKKQGSVGMYDGWETARNPNRPPVFVKGNDGHLVMPGSEQVVVRVGAPNGGIVDKIIVDTAFFKGNYPESVLVEACFVEGKNGESGLASNVDWWALVPRVKCKADSKHEFQADARDKRVTHVRLTVFPDGGVARLRVYGRVSQPSPSVNSCNYVEFERILNELFEPAPPLVSYLYNFHPFNDMNALLDVAENVLLNNTTLNTFSKTQLVEIVNAHPRLGAPKTAALSGASKKEQGNGSDDAQVNESLQVLNETYEAKFGFKLVEFVNGRSRRDLLPVLQKRLDEGTESEELRKGLQAMVDIARDRLRKRK